MKYKKILLILAIASLTLTACKKEPVKEPTSETITEETTTEEAESDETVTNTDITENKVDNNSGNGQGEVDVPDTEAITEASSLNPHKNITKNEDGTYSYTDEFLIAIQEIDGVANLNQEQLEKLLADLTPILFEMPTEADIRALINSEAAWYEWNDFVEETNFGKEKPTQETNNSGTATNNNATNSGSGNSGASQEQNIQEVYVPEVKGEWDDFFFEFEDGSVHTHAPGDGSHVGISH